MKLLPSSVRILIYFFLLPVFLFSELRVHGAKKALPEEIEKISQAIPEKIESSRKHKVLVFSKAFSKLVQEHQTPDIHSVTTSRASLHSLLVTIIRDYENTKDKSKGFEISSCIEASTLRIKENLSNPPTVKQLSREAQISEAGFRKKFRMEIGCSPLDYINRRRIDEAKRLMSLGDPNIKEISHNLGFSSRQYFSTVFKRVTGMSPGDLIKKASQ